MAARKREYSKTILSERSQTILSHLEELPLFRAASCIALYHALPGEVQTAPFIDKWHTKKRLVLPLVDGNDLRLFLYQGPDSVQPGAFGILEPKADGGTEIRPEEIDLMIVPGVAFDRNLHRMGRGKGFYDRLLSTTTAPKVGLCFSFQLLPEIPVEPFDIPMDHLVTEAGFL